MPTDISIGIAKAIYKKQNDIPQDGKILYETFGAIAERKRHLNIGKGFCLFQILYNIMEESN